MTHLGSRALIVTSMTLSIAAMLARPQDKASATPEVPSAEMLKQAKLAGYHVRKLPQGATVFCKSEVHVGTRFSTESCIDETQLVEFLLRAQSQRDELANHKGTATDHK